MRQRTWNGVKNNGETRGLGRGGTWWGREKSPEMAQNEKAMNDKREESKFWKSKSYGVDVV